MLISTISGNSGHKTGGNCSNNLDRFVVKVALDFNQWLVKISSPLMTSWCVKATLAGSNS